MIHLDILTQHGRDLLEQCEKDADNLALTAMSLRADLKWALKTIRDLREVFNNYTLIDGKDIEVDVHTLKITNTGVWLDGMEVGVSKLTLYHDYGASRGNGLWFLDTRMILLPGHPSVPRS